MEVRKYDQHGGGKAVGMGDRRKEEQKGGSTKQWMKCRSIKQAIREQMKQGSKG